MIEDIVNIKSGKRELRKFGITVGIAFGVFGGLFFLRDKDFYRYFLILSGAFIILGLAVPISLKPIQKVWMAFAIVLGWFMTRVILCIAFYLVFTSVGLLAKLFGKRFLVLNFDKSADTYWIKRDSKEFVSSDYERQF